MSVSKNDRILLRLCRVLRSRWQLVVCALTTPLVFAGIFWWIADTGTWTATSQPITASQVKSTIQPRTIVNIDPTFDRRQQITVLRDQLVELRAASVPNPVNVGLVLLQIGKLELAETNYQGASDVFREVSPLHVDGKHWQIREADLRLAALESLKSGTPENRLLWIGACNEYDEAERLYASGHYVEAIAQAEKALNGRLRLWGPTHIETAESLLQLAKLFTEHSDFYLRAEGQVREASERISKTVGTDHPANGGCLLVLATLADDRGDFAGADRLYEESLAVFRTSIGELTREFARVLNRQGRMHNVWWKDFGAGKSFRALQIREQVLHREHLDCAESLEDLGEVSYSLLNFSNAEKLLKEAIAIRTRQQGKDHPDLARPESMLAFCQSEQGDVSHAFVSVRRALSRSARHHGNSHPLVSEQRIVLATIQKRGLSDYPAGYLNCQKTLDGLRELGHQGHPRYCRAIFEQAECLRYEATLGLDESSDHSNMEAARKRTEDAINAYRALPQGERIGSFCEAVTSLCEIYYLQNYPGNSRETARMLVEESERIMTQNGGPRHPCFAFVPLGQARYCSSRGDYERAVPFQLEFARRVEQQVGMTYPWLYADAQQALAGVYLHQATDLESSRRHSDAAFRTYFELSRKNAPSQSDSSCLPLLLDCFLMLSMNLSIAEMQHDLSSTYDHVFAIRGLATSFQAAHRIADSRPELQPLVNAVRKARLEQKVVALSSDATETTVAWSNRLQTASEKSDDTDSELAIETRPYGLDGNESTWQQLQAQLPPRTAFIDFMQYVNHASPPNHHGRLVRNRRMLAYVLKDRGPPQCVALGSSREIEKAVDAWREAVDAFQRSETTDIDLQTRELARLVWAPLQAHLQDVDTLSIAPDGPLCFVSFAALPGRHPGTYALEDFAISYVNSGRWLYGQSQATQGQHGTGLLLCGDIDYQRTKNSRNGSESTKKHREPLLRDISEWSNLAATGLEIEQVAALYQKSHPESARTKAITRGDATANAMEAAMPQDWQTIHFAGHGFFVDPEKAQALAGHFAGSLGQSSYFVQKNQLLLSGLGFAPTDDAPSAPSILTAKDVGSLNLRGTDLVVLSACETGLGCTAGSDGILGLTRAFLTAGSRSVISSLWKVEDSATSLLMEEFYRNLWERGQSKRDALRNAQITVLRTPSKISERSQELALRGIGTGRPKAFIRGVATPGRSHPALWAAFVLNGHGK